MNNQKHVFAIYMPNIPEVSAEETFNINDKAIFHRVVRILRLGVDDQLILFNKQFNLFTKITEITKESFTLSTFSKSPNNELDPKITIFLPLLKNDALKDSIYSCVELGANEIQLIKTQKTHSRKFNIQDYDKLEKIMIAAAEQSKNFFIPQIKKSINLYAAIQDLSKKQLKIYFDYLGESSSNILQKSLKNHENDIVLMVGPEGDITKEERKLLMNSGFIFCALTPTILRSQTAASLGLGMFRSYLSK